MSNQGEFERNRIFDECALNMWCIDFPSHFPEGFSVGDTVGYTKITEVKFGLVEGEEPKKIKKFYLGFIESIERPANNEDNRLQSVKKSLDDDGRSIVRIGNIHVLNDVTGEFKFVPLPTLVISENNADFSPKLVNQCALEEPNRPRAVMWTLPKPVSQI